jgi:CRISP-associated protein Cas1
MRRENRDLAGLRVDPHPELRAGMNLDHTRCWAKTTEDGQPGTWKGRNYDRQNWDMADDINRALSAANASLYALCAAVICSLGYVPALGFGHDAGTLPFVYDVADLYKHLTSIPAAFLAARQDPKDDGGLVRKLLKQRVEEERILQRMPKDLAALFQTTEATPVQAGARPASAL